MRSQFKARAAALTLTAGLVLAACTAPAPMEQGGDTDEATSQPPSTEDAGELTDFYQQELDWSECGSGYECTDVTVPIDYDDPDGETLELAVKKLATGADGAILTNPGGPGQSGIELVDAARMYFSEEVTNEREIVGFDPRGVGDSEGIHCYSDDELEQMYSEEYDVESDAEWEDFVAESESYGEACLDNSGDLLSNVDTVSAARDMDILRAVLGQDTLDYLGFSYGTFLGATYADLFPDQVGRFVLDGAMDPSLSYADVSRGQTEGFELAYRSYLADCTQQANCPFPDDVEKAYEQTASLLEDVAEEPVPTDDPDRPAGDAELMNAITLALYSPETWPMLTEAMTGLINEDDGTAVQFLSDFSLEREPDGSYPDDDGSFRAINCLDYPVEGDREELHEQAEELEELSPVFGPALGYGEVGCSTWPISSDAERETITAEGAAPMLVIGTERDPATPYAWAEELAAQLESGVLLSYDGDGHTAYGNGSCIDDLVDEFLLDGTVPEDGTSC